MHEYKSKRKAKAGKLNIQETSEKKTSLVARRFKLSHLLNCLNKF